jgi:single-stranded DNA-specific DHH superfamily exonuclease
MERRALEAGLSSMAKSNSSMLCGRRAAFVNYTNIANAIKAIEAIRGREEYRRFKINFGKDRCGNPPVRRTAVINSSSNINIKALIWRGMA